MSLSQIIVNTLQVFCSFFIEAWHSTTVVLLFKPYSFWILNRTYWQQTCNGPFQEHRLADIKTNLELRIPSLALQKFVLNLLHGQRSRSSRRWPGRHGEWTHVQGWLYCNYDFDRDMWGKKREKKKVCLLLRL